MDDTGHRLRTADEQLRVADEEIRAQQELIDGLLHARSSERLAALRLAAALPIPLLETDRAGVVRQANPAAAALFHVDPVWLRGKPLAVLVEPADRRALRTALARAVSTGHTGYLSVTVMPRRDGRVPVDVAVIGDPDAPRRQDGSALPDGAVDDPPAIRFVIAPRGAARPAADAALLAALASATTLSAVDGDLHSALARLAELATQGVGPVAGASLTVGSPAEPAVVVSTDHVSQAADGQQHHAGAGPSWDAYATCRPVATAALHADDRWPALRTAGRDQPDAAVAVPVPRGTGDAAGVLTLYGTAQLADEEPVRRAELFADAAGALLREHAAVTELRRQETQLREALTSRAVIDQAKGILMARRGIDAEAAFAELVRRSQHANVRLREVARQLVAEASAGSSRERRSRTVRPLTSAGS